MVLDGDHNGNGQPPIDWAEANSDPTTRRFEDNWEALDKLVSTIDKGDKESAPDNVADNKFTQQTTVEAIIYRMHRSPRNLKRPPPPIPEPVKSGEQLDEPHEPALPVAVMPDASATEIIVQPDVHVDEELENGSVIYIPPPDYRPPSPQSSPPDADYSVQTGADFTPTVLMDTPAACSPPPPPPPPPVSLFSTAPGDTPDFPAPPPLMPMGILSIPDTDHTSMRTQLLDASRAMQQKLQSRQDASVDGIPTIAIQLATPIPNMGAESITRKPSWPRENVDLGSIAAIDAQSSSPLPAMGGELKSELLRAVQTRAWKRGGKVDEEGVGATDSLSYENTEKDNASGSKKCVSFDDDNQSVTSVNQEASEASIPPQPPMLPHVIIQDLASSPESSHSSSNEIDSKRVEYKCPLTGDLKQELLKVAEQKCQERTKRTISDDPGGHREFSSELMRAFHHRETRRNMGALSLRPFKNSRYYKAQTISAKRRMTLPAKVSDKGKPRLRRLDSSEVLMKNISKVEKRDNRTESTKSRKYWTPAQDLPDDDFDDRCPGTLTQRASDFYEVNWAQVQTQTLFKKSNFNSPTKPKKSRMQKIQRSMRNAFGSIRGKMSHDQSMRNLASDGWVILPTGSYDTPPSKPVKISRVEAGSAYAFNSERGEMYLIPNFDKVLVTDEGLRIRERQLNSDGVHRKLSTASTESSGPIVLGQVLESNNTRQSPNDIRIEEERRLLQEAETPFRVIQQMNTNYKAEDVGQDY